MAYNKKYKVSKFHKNGKKKSLHNIQKGKYYPPFIMDMTLQRTIGNQEVQRLFKNWEIQAKLFVNKPGDKYEQEADRIAKRIVNMGDKEVQLKTSETKVQKKVATIGGENISSQIEAKIKSLKGKGQPLEPKIRDYFQPRFGVDLKDIHIHTDTNADRLARAIRARAFTLGKDVVFARNEYKPETHKGKKLIAHELTHVLQQNKNVNTKMNIYRQKEPAWKRVQDFQSKTYSKQNHVPGTGRGFFNVSLNPVNGRLEIRLKLKFNFIDGSAIDFTGTSESRIWTNEEKTKWKNDFIALIEGRWGGKYRFVNPDLPGLKIYVDVELDAVTSNSHYLVNVTKIPTGKTNQSSVTHYLDSSTYSALQQFDKHKVTLDSEDLNWANKGVSEKQKGAIHEFGHMIGLGDEYNDGTPGVRHSKLYADAYGITGVSSIILIPEGKTNDIMSCGNTINPRHYVTFLEALKIITGMNNWKFE